MSNKIMCNLSLEDCENINGGFNCDYNCYRNCGWFCICLL